MTERNAPCYCGSGIKYKKCHGRNEVKGGVPVRVQLTHDDRREANKLLTFMRLAENSQQAKDKRLVRVAYRRHQFD